MPRRQTNSCHLKRWQPNGGDYYYIILGNGIIKIFPWNDTDFDHEAWYFGNCFRTHKEAVYAREKIAEVLRTVHQEHA